MRESKGKLDLVGDGLGITTALLDERAEGSSGSTGGTNAKSSARETEGAHDD